MRKLWLHYISEYTVERKIAARNVTFMSVKRGFSLIIVNVKHHLYNFRSVILPHIIDFKGKFINLYKEFTCNKDVPLGSGFIINSGL